ncbi:MAG: Phosphoribosylglycinamide formyltransferase [uncultured bacterium]|nr:MAG: Phosphoribosylglycinamide formyltransferase [uncultured bacterium]
MFLKRLDNVNNESMKKLAILISDAGTGTNLQAIIDSGKNKKLKAKIALVISSSENAYGLQRAKKNRILTMVVGKKNNLEKILKDNQIDLVVLAGWKLIIPKTLINTFKNKVLNLHPGLIPDTMSGVVKNPDKTIGLWNRGKLTDIAIKNFLDKKATYAGSTVHFLSQEFDFGEVLNRCFEKILPNDTVESLYARLKKKENKIYVESLMKLCN